MRDHPLASLVHCNHPKYNKKEEQRNTIKHTDEIKEVFRRNIAKEKLALISKLISHYEYSAIEFSNMARKLRIKSLTNCVQLYTYLYNKPQLLEKVTEEMV